VCGGSACPKCEEMHAAHARKKKQHDKRGTEKRVEKLMKACYDAIDEGNHERAAHFARKAHRLDPQRVEGEPVVYKLDLLAEKATVPTSTDSPPKQAPAPCNQPNNDTKKQDAQPDGSTSIRPEVPACTGQIFIVGSERTPQNVILREVPLYPGQ